MNSDMKKDSLIRHWYHPKPAEVGDNILEFVRLLGGPCRIEIPGRDRSRCRVLVTLLHGNETSGVSAFHALLKEDFEPHVTLYCYLIGIEAALTPPEFTHRQVPGKRDYNRCFRPPFGIDKQGRICQQLLQEIAVMEPEFVVDMHNTSGAGPAFAVTTRLAREHEAVISMFTARLVVTDLRLGALMEADSDHVPFVTIECGGASEATADRLALDGLRRYFGARDILRPPAADWQLDLYRHPMRVELQRTARIAYGEAPSSTADLTLKVDVEHHNFGVVDSSTLLGWVAPGGAPVLSVLDADGRDHADSLYRIEQGCLYPRCRQKLFMITGNPVIAHSDCLWYTVPD